MIGSTSSILVVDDESLVVNAIKDLFKRNGWVVHTANDGLQVLHLIRELSPDLILMDVKMPGRDGITTCRIIRNDITMIKHFPIILMSGQYDREQVLQSMDAGCDDFIVKPFKSEVLLKKVESLVAFFQKAAKKDAEVVEHHQEESETAVIIRSKKAIRDVFSNAMHGKLINYPEVQEVVEKMIDILHKEKNLPMAFKMKSYNDYTYIHSVNVASLCMSFAYHLQWNDFDIKAIGEGGFLHDIGKTKVDLQIVIKPEKLTDDEFSQMMKHPLHAKGILEKQSITKEILQAAMEHHERIDGNGYPYKLPDKQISKYGKLVSIVDTYDALTTDRCYHNAIDSDEAVDLMSTLPGRYDPALFEVFSSLIKSETIGK